MLQNQGRRFSPAELCVFLRTVWRNLSASSEKPLFAIQRLSSLPGTFIALFKYSALVVSKRQGLGAKKRFILTWNASVRVPTFQKRAG